MALAAAARPVAPLLAARDGCLGPHATALGTPGPPETTGLPPLRLRLGARGRPLPVAPTAAGHAVTVPLLFFLLTGKTTAPPRAAPPTSAPP